MHLASGRLGALTFRAQTNGKAMSTEDVVSSDIIQAAQEQDRKIFAIQYKCTAMIAA
jgi:hypothetical protein